MSNENNKQLESFEQEEYHEHNHGAIDASLLNSQQGLKAITTSAIVLFSGALLQLIIVVLSGSVSLLSDSIHNLGDAATAIPLTIAFRLGKRKPTQRFTYGYGKAEDLAGITILLFMLSSAMYAAYVSFGRLLHPTTISHLWLVIIASLVGFVINEAAANYRIRVGKQINSEALVTDGKHARMDGLTSLAVLIGALGAYFGFPILDPIVGLLISALILHTVWKSGHEVFSRALDGINPKIVTQVKRIVLEVSEVKQVSETRVRWLGHSLHAEINIAVDPKLTIEEGHDVAQEVRHELKESLPHLSHIIIHVDPNHSSGEHHHEDNHDH